MMSSLYTLPTRATDKKPGGKGKEPEKKKKKKKDTVILSQTEEIVKFNPPEKLLSLRKDWGPLEAAMKSTENPSWLVDLTIPDKVGFALKYNPNDPNELPIYARRERRNRIKNQNTDMKETKGIPQKKHYDDWD